ncbi:MAG TPA: ABC transporter permease [Herbaspirillum sp.]
MDNVIQILVSGLFVGSIFAMLALSFSLVFRVTGVINLAQGAFCVLAALAGYSLHVTFGWSLLASSIFAVVGTSLLGALLGATIFVRAMARLSNTNILMLGAGLMTFIEGAIFVVWDSQPYAPPPFSGEEPITVFGIRIVTQGIWIAGIISLLVLAMWFLMSRTTLGRTLRACSENPVAARLMGVNVRAMSIISFGLSAFIAAVGGVTVAPIMSVQFDTPTAFAVLAFIAMTIGGVGSFVGAVVGGLIIGVVGQIGAAYFSSLFSNGIVMALLLGVLIFRPDGLFQRGGKKRDDVRQDVRAHARVIRLTERNGWSLAAIGLAIVLLLPMMIPDSQAGLLNTFVITGILFIAVMGLDVLMGYTGQVNLGQAGFMAIGGYASAKLASAYGMSPLASLGAAIALALVCALVLALITMKLRGLYLALATLAFGLLIDSLVNGLVDFTGGPSGLVGIPPFAIGDYVFDSQMAMYYFLVALIAVLLVVLTGLLRSGFGRALQAIRTDQIAASALGINVPVHKAVAFLISAGLGALSGSLYAFNIQYLSPEMVGMWLSLGLVTMLIVGGEGTLVGGLFGVAVLTILPNLFKPLAHYMMLATGAVLILTFLYFPAGIYGTFARIFTNRKDRTPAVSPNVKPLVQEPVQ